MGLESPQPCFRQKQLNSRNGAASSHIPQNERSASTCRVIPLPLSIPPSYYQGKKNITKKNHVAKGHLSKLPSVHPGWRSFNLFLKVHEQSTQQSLGPRAGVDTAGIKNPYYFHGHKSQEVGRILDRKACSRMYLFSLSYRMRVLLSSI